MLILRLLCLFTRGLLSLVHLCDTVLDDCILPASQNYKRTLRHELASSLKDATQDMFRNFYFMHSSPYNCANGALIQAIHSWCEDRCSWFLVSYVYRVTCNFSHHLFPPHQLRLGNFSRNSCHRKGFHLERNDKELQSNSSI